MPRQVLQRTLGQHPMIDLVIAIVDDGWAHPQCPCLWVADDAGPAEPADASPAPDGWRLTEFGGHVGNPGPSGFTEDERR